MRKRRSVCQGANCSHVQYYVLVFAILDFRGIDISNTVDLTLLIILTAKTDKILLMFLSYFKWVFLICIVYVMQRILK